MSAAEELDQYAVARINFPELGKFFVRESVQRQFLSIQVNPKRNNLP